MQDAANKKKVYCSMTQSAFHFQQKLQNSLPYHYARTPLHRLQEQLELYQWRKQRKNNFICFDWLQIEPYSDKEVTIILRSMQKLTTLSSTAKIKTNQFIKKLSKVFTSFKLLYDRFGPFEVSPQMVAFDSLYQPLVWMNSEHIKNEYKREYVSEQEFGQNILLLLLKFNNQFGVQGFAEHCYKVRGQKKSLSALSDHFFEYNQRKKNQIFTKVSNSSTLSQDGILNFSQISRKKKKNIAQYRSNKQMSYFDITENKSTEDLFFKNLSSSKKLTESCDNKRNCSFNSLKLPQDLDSSIYFQQVEMTKKIKAFTYDTQKNPLTVSINLDQSEEYGMSQIVQLPQLDQYKRCLVKSIINKDGMIKDHHF